MNEFNPDLFSIVVLVIALGFLPFVAVMLTAFLKISVVLMILRNAMGIQQVPSNLVLNGLAIILATYIATPIFGTVYDELSTKNINFRSFSDWEQTWEIGRKPVKDFLAKYSRPEDRKMFLRSAKKVWGKENSENVKHDDLMVLIPSFVLSELTRAFEIGVLIYLPFIAIDIIVSVILMALGMMMVSPIMIAIPFKLFLFVVLNGWSRLVQGLLLSYSSSGW